MSRDAALLLEAGGAAAAPDPDAMASQLREWLTSSEGRHAAGERARAIVRSGIGAADRTVALVVRLLERR
jgi:3-deoxy-D-manno-octulosonic-acid transferase